MFSSPLHTCEATPVVRTRIHHPFIFFLSLVLQPCSPAKTACYCTRRAIFFIQKKPMAPASENPLAFLCRCSSNRQGGVFFKTCIKARMRLLSGVGRADLGIRKRTCNSISTTMIHQQVCQSFASVYCCLPVASNPWSPFRSWQERRFP
jgi:hypothetical protein